jgi:tetratricopeptide (TPR) repeat protein
MAPEQVEGKPREVGPAVDIYALGAVLYEMLTGRPPFQGETVFDTLDQVCTQEPVPPRRLQPRVPRDLETICLKCLQKEPHKRYPSAAALAEDLASYLQGQPIRARPVPAWEWAVKWARRRPAVALLLAANVLGPALLLAWYTARLRQTNAELTQALTTANEQRAEAEGNLHLAWQVTDDMLMVGQDWFNMTHWYERSTGRPHRMRGKILQEALNCHEMFIRIHRENPAMRDDVARAYLVIGDVYGHLERDAEAADAYRQARRLYWEGVREVPENPRQGRGLFLAVRDLSKLQLRMGQAHAAVETYARAIEELEALLGKTPRGEAARSCLGEVHGGLAGTLCSLGRYAPALAAWDRALQVAPEANRDEYLARQAVCRAYLGDHASAAAAARAATAHGEVWYEAACAYARCSAAAQEDARLSTGRRQELAEQYARQAVDQLRRAAADREFTNFQTALRMLETDKDLDPLRARPDFQKLLAEQQAQAQRIRAVPEH